MRLHQAVLSEGGLALPNASQPTPVQWERQFTVVIDPGHGRRQPGAHYSGVSEKEINLSVALKLENLLTARGYQVVMTRSDDTGIGLYERAELANASGADLFVSLHSNAMVNAPNFQGILTYHYPSDSSGAELAQSIQTAVCQATGGADRGVRSADFVVLRETDMSAALVEMGYMSSPGMPPTRTSWPRGSPRGLPSIWVPRNKSGRCWQICLADASARNVVTSTECSELR